MIENFLFFAISGFFLVISGIYLVKSLNKIAIFLKISEFSAAFILMALATSLPELFVGISSAIQGVPQLSLGNVIGANIIDLTLLMGIFILMSKGIEFKTKKIDKNIYFMLASIFLLVVLYLIGNSLSRIDGVILLLLFAANAFRLIRKSMKYSAKIKSSKKHSQHIKLGFLILFILSLMVLFISARYLVKYSHNIALDLNLPEIFIGVFLLSFATTLPELVFGVNAIMLKHETMSLGDLTGAAFTNICLVLGVVSVIHPIQVELAPFLLSGVFMLLTGIIFVTFIKSGRKLEIYEGISLIGMYLFFAVLQFVMRSML